MTLIVLDGKVSSSLDWSAQKELALSAIQNGSQLQWMLDLGLFGQLKSLLSNQTQFLSLLLSLEHFRDTLWNEFKEHTSAVILYDGSADFSRQILWDDKHEANYLDWCEKTGFNDQSLFCRDVAAEYLTLLANRMPDEMPLAIKLHLDTSHDLVKQIQLTHRERFGRIVVETVAFPTLSDTATVALCLPSFERVHPQYYAGVEEALSQLITQSIPFKIIPETTLISEWDGLDYLLVVRSGLSSQGLRKLHGFCAAGGTVVSLGESLGVAHETSWVNFADISIV